MTDATERWEAALARSVGAREAVSFGFARTALACLLRARGIGEGDDVLLSPLTCKVVVLAVLSTGARAVFADTAPGSLNFDAEASARAATPGAKALLFQHTYGVTAGFEAAAELASERGWLLIEDAAQSVPVASAGPFLEHGSAGVLFSMNLMKPLPAAAGGALLTNDPEIAAGVRVQRAKLAPRSTAFDPRTAAEEWAHRLLLWPRTYWPLLEAFRLTASGYRQRPLDEEIASEITSEAAPPSPRQVRRGLAMLQQAEAQAAARLERCRRYDELLPQSPLAGAGKPLYGYPVRLTDKHGFLRAAKSAFLEAVAWPGGTPVYPIDDYDALGPYGYERGSCPHAEDAARTIVLLPTHPRVSSSFQDRIAVLAAAHGADRAV